MGQRYEVRKRPLTDLERRFFPGDADKPFVVWDTKQDRAVGRRYGSKSGADVAAEGRNAKQARKARLAAGKGS